MNVFSVDNLCMSFAAVPIIENLQFDIEKGSITAIVGPNGSGKTTLIRVLSRTLRPTAGCVMYKGRDIFTLSTRTVAQTLAVLPQARHTPEGLTVEMLAGYGRFPHTQGYGMLKKNDKEILDWALEKTHMIHLSSRSVEQLSGGELQRAWIAMALVQKPEVLILDEPTTFLDIAYQLEILELLRLLNQETSLTIIMVLHDLNHALRYADSIMILRDKHIRALGPGTEVLTRETLNREFSIDGDLYWDTRSNCPFIIPYRHVNHEKAF